MNSGENSGEWMVNLDKFQWIGLREILEETPKRSGFHGIL